MTEKRKITWTTPWLVASLALLCSALWGSAFPAIKIGYQLFQISADAVGSQLLFAGCRFILAGFMTIVLGSFLQRKPLLPQKQSWKKIFHLAMLQTALQYFFFYIGLAHTSGVKGSIIVGTNSLIAILLASLLFRQEILTPRKLCGCILGLLGVIIANLSSEQISFDYHWLGEGFVFLSVLSYGFSSVVIKIYSKQENPVLLSGYQFILGGFILLLCGVCLGGKFTTVNPAALAILGYLALLSAIAYTLWGGLLKYNSVSRVAIYGFMNPVIGVILSALLLQENAQAFQWKNIIALLLVSAGIYVVNRVKTRDSIYDDNDKE